MASTALACLGHDSAGSTNFGAAVRNFAQPGWYPSTFDEFAFGANAPREVEVAFYVNTTSLNGKVLFNSFQFSESILPGLRIRATNNGNPVNFEIRIRTISNATIFLNIPVNMTLREWYHLYIRLTPGGTGDYLAQAFIGPLGVGLTGTTPSVPIPFPYPDSNTVVMTGITETSPFQDRSMKVFGKSQDGQVFSVGIGGTPGPSGGSFIGGTQWPGGFANFRVWSINRTNPSDIDFGARNFLTPETTPGLVHAWRFNETVTTGGEFDDVGLKNAQWEFVANNGAFSGKPESPITPPSQTFTPSVSDTISLSETRDRTYRAKPTVIDTLPALESVSPLNLNFLQGADTVGASESISLDGTFSRTLGDTTQLSETVATNHQMIDGFAVSRTESIGLSELRSTVVTRVLSISDTLPISETESSVKTIGGSGVTPWNTAVGNLNPEYWLKLDDIGFGSIPIVNSGSTGTTGDCTSFSLLNAYGVSPIVQGSTSAILFGPDGYMTADNQAAWFIPAGQASATFLMWADIQTTGAIQYLVERLGNFFLNITAADELELNIPQSPGTGATRTAPGSVTPGIHMLAFTVSPGSFGRKLYIDGVLAASAPAAGDVLFQATQTTQFGRDAQTLTGGYNMTVDEIVMWNNAALTDQQIADLYNSGTSSSTGGVAVGDTVKPSEAVSHVQVFGPSVGTVSDTISVSETVTKAHKKSVPLTETVSLSEGTTAGVTGPQSWGVRFRLETNSTVIPGDLTDFPAFLDFTDVKLKTTANGGEVTNASGYDIRFYNDAAGITALDYELVTYDGATGRVKAWVKIPSLSGSVTTNVFLLAGNTNFTTDGSSPAGVFSAFDGASGNSVVWHLDDTAGSGVDYPDALGNHAAVKTGLFSTWCVPDTAAQVDTGYLQNFHGGGVAAVGSSSNDIFGPNYLFTDFDTSSVSVWFKPKTTLDNVEGVIAGSFATTTGRMAAFVMDKTAHTVAWRWYDTSNVKTEIATGVDLDTDTGWHHYYATWDKNAGANGTMTVYLDGTQVGQDTTSGMASALGEPNIAQTVTNRYDGTSGLRGTVDEAKITDYAPSANWVATEYVNQNDATVSAGNFWGAAVDVSAGIKYAAGASDTVGVSENLAASNEKQLEATILSGSAVPSEPVKGDVLVSVVEIWNTALTVLGSDTVTSTSDSSKEASILNGAWPSFRGQWLQQNPWNGAKTTKTLSRFQNSDSTDVTPNGSRWSYAYLLPDSTDDFPYIHALTLNGMELRPDNRQFEIEAVANDAGTIKRCLLTDEATADLEYIFDTKDANIDLLSPLTKHAMGLAFAAEVAPRFGKGAAEIQMLRQEATEAAVKARASDGQEGTFRRFQSHPIIDVRR